MRRQCRANALVVPGHARSAHRVPLTRRHRMTAHRRQIMMKRALFSLFAAGALAGPMMLAPAPRHARRRAGVAQHRSLDAGARGAGANVRRWRSGSMPPAMAITAGSIASGNIVAGSGTAITATSITGVSDLSVWTRTQGASRRPVSFWPDGSLTRRGRIGAEGRPKFLDLPRHGKRPDTVLPDEAPEPKDRAKLRRQVMMKRTLYTVLAAAAISTRR